MTDKETLLALAERCEQAAGPDRDLDDAILLAVNGGERPMRPVEGLANARTTYHEDYTASLDAAMTLYVRVPERVPSNPSLAVAEALRQRAEQANG